MQSLISTWGRGYGMIITVATRYSMFGTQFKGKAGEKKVIYYQTQKDKIISRVAETYAISFAGHNCSVNRVKKWVTDKNEGWFVIDAINTHRVVYHKALFS